MVERGLSFLLSFFLFFLFLNFFFILFSLFYFIVVPFVFVTISASECLERLLWTQLFQPWSSRSQELKINNILALLFGAPQ